MKQEIFYQVKNQTFLNKIDALRYASTFPELTPRDVKFYFHHNSWNSFDRSLLGKISLRELYKQRAMQIRESYDYLVLYYTGGPDSHNILMTFLDNNILLEELVIKWPKKLIGSNLYTPNNKDLSAKNFVSEWDFVIEPELKRIASKYPNIKITINDYVEDIPDNYYNEDTFALQNHMHSAINLLRMQTFTKAEKNPKGKRVCGITGLDKPLLVKHNGSAWMYFSDDIVMSQPKLIGSYRENFYWTPDFPLLTMEMAHQVYMHFKINHLQQQFLLTSVMGVELDEIRFDMQQTYYRLIKPVIYETWDMRKFQADKPFHGFKADKDFWFYDSPEFEKPKQQWRHHYESQLSSVHEKFCQVDPTGKKTGYRKYITPLYHIGEF